MNKIRLIPLILAAFIMNFFSGALWPADITTFYISLPEAEKLALEQSPKLRSAELELEAFKNLSESQRALLYPKIILDGSFKYITEVPKINLPLPGLSPKKLGDNVNYSIGPALNWTVWDGNATKESWQSLLKLKESKGEEIAAVKRGLILQARTLYFQLQMALEQVMLFGDSMKVAQAQYEDIKINVKEGTKSTIDALQAHQELLLRKRQIRQARADLAAALRELVSLTGFGKEMDVSLPLDARMSGKEPKTIEPATLLVKLDDADRLIASFGNVESLQPDSSNPMLLSLSYMADSYRHASESYHSNLWPRLTFSAKSSLDYPNGTELSSFNQNSFGANLIFPLFESGRSKDQSREQSYRASSIEKKREQTEKDILKDWDKAADQLRALRAQQEINKEIILETEELEKLIYSSYMTGRSTYLDVQTSNLRALEAKVQLARTNAQILIQLATLASLGK